MKAFLPATTRTLSAVTLASLLSTVASAAFAETSSLIAAPDRHQVKKKASKPTPSAPPAAPQTRTDSAYDALTTGTPTYNSVVADRSNSDIYGPGEITVYGTPHRNALVGNSTVSADAIYTLNKNTLDEAANLIPGVNSANTGGTRNERTILVRGFNRFQVPLMVDGIRIYLPADNRLDYGRFLTPDIAEIQVAKGYASVLDGPDAMGGMVNLVTRKPHKELEGELRGGSMLRRVVS